MASPTGPADGTDDDGVVADWSPETAAALFRALESVEADVSPQLALSVQATINAVKQVGREFGFLTGSEALDALGPGNDSEAHDFILRYRGQTLYPRFLFEPSPGEGGRMRVRPLMKDLKKIADKYGWAGADVVLWMTSPTTWFADGGALSTTLKSLAGSWPRSRTQRAGRGERTSGPDSAELGLGS